MTPSEHPQYHLGFFFLAVVFIISFSLQIFTVWLENSISYGNLNLAFTSEALDLSVDIAHKQGKLYIAVPERRFSIIITNREIKRFIREYRFSAKITILNILGTLAFFALIFGAMFIARNWQKLQESFRKLLLALVGYSHFLLTSFLLSVLLLASLFPLTEFLGWWQKFSFVKTYPVPGSLERAVYDFMTMFAVLPRHRLFYAFLLILPSFFLRLTVLLTLTVLILFWMPIPKVMQRFFAGFTETLKKIDPRILVLTGALFLLLITNLKSFYSYHHLPVSAVGASMSFQAKAFQAGKISYPLPRSKEFFEFPYISSDIRWFSQFAPGWPAFLSIGYWLRLPWLLNPLFVAGFFYLFYRFSQNIYDRHTATLSCLLLVISPAFVEIGAGFLQYPSLVFFLWSFLYQAQKAENTDDNTHALLAGIFFGISLDIDPKISISFGIPVVFYLLILFIKRRKWLRGGIFLGAAVLSSMPILLHNYFLTGKLLVSGFNHLYGVPLSAQEKPFLDSFIFALFRLGEINKSLFYWPVPALSFFSVFIILLRTDKERWDYLLILCLMGCFITNVFYIDSHPGSSNFLLSMIPVFVLFSSRAILLLPKWLSSLNLAPQRTTALLWIILLWLFLPGSGRLFSFPEKSPDIAAKLQRKNIDKALVFMDKEWDEYRIGFGMNQPDLKNSRYIIARDLGAYNQKLIGEFPDRPAFRFRPYEEVEFLPLTAEPE